MHVSKESLLLELPPYRDEWVVRAQEQRVKDIIKWTLNAYPRFASDYDRIGLFFLGRTVAETCDNLYEFCIRNIQYVEEGEDWQSIERPAGILTRGFCDCKGYANFIGGCLGAINRITGAGIDWHFYYASYKEKERTPYHVFITVRGEDGEIWVDPTPGSELMTPKHWILKKVKEPMPLMENIGSLMENVGRVNQFGELHYTMGAAIPATGDSTTDASVQAVNAFVQSLPDGELKTALNKSMTGALPMIAKWISGYKYTGGDYALGEIFLNRVMNKATSSRWETPDQVVPIAWMYFTTLFGIPIAVNTDLDNIESGSLSQYLSGRGEQTGYVSQEQVTRAKHLLDMLGHRSQLDPQWPPSSFNILPYVGPIPDPRIPGMLFSGTLPNGQGMVNGLPVTAAAPGQGIMLPGAPSAVPVTTASLFGGGNKTLLLIGAAVVVGYLLLSDHD